MLPGRVVRGRANPLHWKFPERLRRARKAAGLNPFALSVAAGIAKNSVSALEEGEVCPRLPKVEQLARALGRSPAWLAFGLGDDAAVEPAPGCAGLKLRAREARGLLAVKELARRAATSPAQVRAVESGSMPSLDTLEDLARALGVSPAWLAFGEGPRELPRRGAKPAPAAAATPSDPS